MGDENKTTQELVDELKALVEKYDAPAEDGTAQEPTEQDAERMSQLTAEIEKRNAAAEKNRETLSAIEDDLFKLALTYRACGGARGEFVESAAAQAARAYATISDVPESASTKRSMKKHPARSSVKKGAVEGPSAQGA